MSALAVAAGIRQPHMSLIEKGDRQPSDAVLVRIAQSLNIDDLRAIQRDPGDRAIAIPAPSAEQVA